MTFKYHCQPRGFVYCIVLNYEIKIFSKDGPICPLHKCFRLSTKIKLHNDHGLSPIIYFDLFFAIETKLSCNLDFFYFTRPCMRVVQPKNFPVKNDENFDMQKNCEQQRFSKKIMIISLIFLTYFRNTKI